MDLQDNKTPVSHCEKCLFKICVLIFLFTIWTIDCNTTWKVKEKYLVWPKKANSHSEEYYYARLINNLLLRKFSYPCICILFQPFKEIQPHLLVEGQEFLYCNTIWQCYIRNLFLANNHCPQNLVKYEVYFA